MARSADQMMEERHVLCPRRAGQVRRYHTWPYLREQTVAEHSWNVARILYAIWPEAPREIYLHALFHDIGELRTGDAPYPLKAHNPTLKGCLDATERQAWVDMAVEWDIPLPQLSDNYMFTHMIKIADLIEMWEWGWYELNLGNRYARLVVSRCNDALMGIVENAQTNWPIPGMDQRIHEYMDKRDNHEREIYNVRD